MTPESLFDRVVQASGLSSVFATKAVRCACARSNVDAETMNHADLERALPEIEGALGVFLKPHALATRMRAIGKLMH
jgi:hypothetical protein